MTKTEPLHGKSAVSRPRIVESVGSVTTALPDDRVSPPVEDDDVRLVLALRKGDKDAPSVMFDRYGPHVQRALARMLGYTDQERGDLLHDVFVRALDRVHTLENPRALRAWLTQIAVFTAREWVRRRKRLGLREADGAPDVRGAPAAPPEVVEAVRSFYAIMDQLSAEDRTVFVLRFVEGMNLHEVASACGVSFSTARRWVGRADERFRRMLRDYPALVERLEENRK